MGLISWGGCNEERGSPSQSCCSELLWGIYNPEYCSVKHTPKNLCHHPSQAKRLTQCQTCFEIPFLRVQAQLIRVIYGDYDRLSDKYCNPETNSLHLYHKKNNPLQFQPFFFFFGRFKNGTAKHKK